MARPKAVVTSNQIRSIVSRYGKGVGLVALSTEFHFSIPVIRRVLVEAGSTIRKRGKPAKVA